MTHLDSNQAVSTGDGPNGHAQALAQRACDGDDRALETLIHLYRPRLLALAGRIVRDGRAEDAVQVALLNLHRTLQAGDVPANVEAWLTVVTRRTALDQLRRTAATDPLSQAETAVAKSAEAVAESRGELRQVLSDVAALPADERDALLLRTVDGAGHREIAAQLSVTPGQARQLIHRARRRLRDAAAILLPAWMAFRVQEARAAAGRVTDWATAGATAGPARAIAAVVAVGAVGVVGSPGTLQSPPDTSAHGRGAVATPSASGPGRTRPSVFTASAAKRTEAANGQGPTTRASTNARAADRTPSGARPAGGVVRAPDEPNSNHDSTSTAGAGPAPTAAERPSPPPASPSSPATAHAPSPSVNTSDDAGRRSDDDDRVETSETAEPSHAEDTPVAQPAESPDRPDEPESRDDSPGDADGPEPAEPEDEHDATTEDQE